MRLAEWLAVQLVESLAALYAGGHCRSVCRDQHVLLHAHRQRYVDAAADRCGAGAYPPGDEVGLDHHRRWNGGDWIVPELLHQCCELVVGIGAGYATHGENVAVRAAA